MQNLKEALTEVRKSYRMIHSYQRRILDMTNYIIEKMDYKSYWWDNEYFNVRSNRLPSDRWAYDSMPLYMGSGMLYLHKDIDYGTVKIGEGLLEIQFDADSGFNYSKAEPETSTFRDAEDCHSYLYLGAICGLKEEKKNWLDNIFYETTYPKVLESNIIYTSLQYPYILFRARYDLSEIEEENDLKRIIEIFQTKIIDELAKESKL